MKGSRIQLAVCLLLLAQARVAVAETDIDLGLSSDLAGGTLSPSAVMGIDTGFRLAGGEGRAFALDFSAEGAYSLLDPWFSGSANLEISAYRMSGPANLGLRLQTVAVLPATALPGSLAFALSLPFTLNGPGLSLSLAPVVSIDPLDTGYGSFGLDSGISFMVGNLVLKPGLGFALIYPWSGGTILSFKPGLTAAWYPGIPLSLEISGEYRMSTGDAALPVDALELKGSLAAAPVPWLLLTCLASSSMGSLTTESSLSLEASFTLARKDGGRELALPLMLGYESSAAGTGISLGLGLRYIF